MMRSDTLPQPGVALQFWRLTKPRVNSLIVFTAVIGMLLAAPALPPAGIVFAATVGIALVAGAAAAFNCLVEQRIDASMARTRGRPTVIGTISDAQILLFAGVVGGLGLAVRRSSPAAGPGWPAGGRRPAPRPGRTRRRAGSGRSGRGTR